MKNYNQVVTLVRFVYFGSCASFSIMSGLIWHTVSKLEFLSGLILKTHWKKKYTHVVDNLSYRPSPIALYFYSTRSFWFQSKGLRKGACNREFKKMSHRNFRRCCPTTTKVKGKNKTYMKILSQCVRLILQWLWDP